jgi:hypothetical protein
MQNPAASLKREIDEGIGAVGECLYVWKQSEPKEISKTQILTMVNVKAAGCQAPLPGALGEAAIA